MALGKRIQNYPDATTLDGSEYFVAAQKDPDYTLSGTTFSSNATAQTVSDSAAGFLSAGFFVGQAVNIVSPTQDLVSLILTDVTANTLIFGGTDGAAIATESAGGSWTITGWKTVRLTAESALAAAGFFASKEVTSTAYTLILGDVGKRLNMNNVAANTCTVPNNSSVAFPLDSEIEIVQIGAGQTTIVVAAGVTVNCRAGLVFPQQYAYARLKKRATNTWELIFEETTTSLGQTLYGATAKATPVDADLVPLGDSAAYFLLKKLTWANVKATLKTYFDTLYNVVVFQGDGLDVDACGYRGLPQNSQSGNYTLVAADAGKHIIHPNSGGTGDTFTIPANSSVAFEVGTTITFVNRDSNSVSIAITSDTMYLANSTTTGTRTLAQNGWATAMKVESTVWIISGPGLS